MTEFHSYTHIEYLSSDETEGLFNGTIYVEPKIDGTNMCMWLGEDGRIHIGKRRSEVNPEDLQGMDRAYEGMKRDVNAIAFAETNPSWVIYGEFLQPMHIRYYEKDAYDKFYIFDVFDKDEKKYLEPELWMDEAKKAGCNVIPVIAKLTNFKEHVWDRIDETWEPYIDMNRFLLPEDKSLLPEGIIFKNYGFVNKYGRHQVFAKIVVEDFKHCLKRAVIPEDQKVEDRMMQLVLKYCSDEIIHKAYTHVVLTVGLHDKSSIPRIFEESYHNFIIDKLWIILKKEKNPVIDFAKLREAVISKVKLTLPELFYK